MLSPFHVSTMQIEPYKAATFRIRSNSTSLHRNTGKSQTFLSRLMIRVNYLTELQGVTEMECYEYLCHSARGLFGYSLPPTSPSPFIHAHYIERTAVKRHSSENRNR